MNNRNKSGFTLIELLVVIAIIAILAAILFPMFTKAKERANQTQCLSNMAQLGKAIQAYADDSNGVPPTIRTYDSLPQHNWCGSYGCGAQGQNPPPNPPDPTKGQLFRYCKSAGIFACPSDKNKKPDWNLNWAKFPLSYSMNYSFEVHPAIPGGFMKLESVQPGRAKKTMLLLHESRRTINDGDFNLSSVDEIGDVHWDGTNILYVDLHANYRSKIQLAAEKKWWDLNVINP